MCCGADDDLMLGGKRNVQLYYRVRLQYADLEARFADKFVRLKPCVADFDTGIPTPNGIRRLFDAYEKTFNELLQAKSNVELLHHYATITKFIDGLRMAAQIALGAQYQLYRAKKPEFLRAPAGVKKAAALVREALDGGP